MVVVCREQLEELKKKATEITEKESCNKQLLLENANLKKLLSEVHNEMRQLKEVRLTKCVSSTHDPLLIRSLAVLIQRVMWAHKLNHVTPT